MQQAAETSPMKKAAEDAAEKAVNALSTPPSKFSSSVQRTYSQERRLSHDEAELALQLALAEAADAQQAGNFAEVRESAASARAAKRVAAEEVERLTAQAERLKVEIEKMNLTKRLWDLVKVEPGSAPQPTYTTKNAAIQREVARVWPIVVATFEKLSKGVDELTDRLVEQATAREAAEAKLEIMQNSRGAYEVM